MNASEEVSLHLTWIASLMNVSRTKQDADSTRVEGRLEMLTAKIQPQVLMMKQRGLALVSVLLCSVMVGTFFGCAVFTQEQIGYRQIADTLKKVAEINVDKGIGCLLVSLRYYLRDGMDLSSRHRQELLSLLKDGRTGEPISAPKGDAPAIENEWLLCRDVMRYLLGDQKAVGALQFYRQNGYWLADYALLMNGDTNALGCVAAAIQTTGIELHGPSDEVTQVIPIWIARVNERLHVMSKAALPVELQENIRTVLSYHYRLMKERMGSPLHCDDADVLREIRLAVNSSTNSPPSKP